jgi:ATP-dependent Lon protease
MNSKLYLDIDNLSAQSLEDDAELIPLLTPEDEEEMDREDVPEVLPILPLRNTVLFPGVVIPITAGRDTSIALIKAANQGTKTIGVVAQKDASVEEPGIEDVYDHRHGCKNITCVADARRKHHHHHSREEALSDRYSSSRKALHAGCCKRAQRKKPESNNREFEAMVDGIKEVALKIIKINPNLPSEASFAIQNIQSGSFLINFVSSNLNLRLLRSKNC